MVKIVSTTHGRSVTLQGIKVVGHNAHSRASRNGFPENNTRSLVCVSLAEQELHSQSDQRLHFVICNNDGFMHFVYY